MKGDLDVTPNLNRKLDLAEFSSNSTRCIPKGDYASIQNIGSEIEKERLRLIVDLIKKRRVIRDQTVARIDSLIVYCDNKILELGNDYEIRACLDLQKEAGKWRKMVLELEEKKLGENKELFRDCLFLRNEWIKSLLSYSEEKKLDGLIKQMGQPSGLESTIANSVDEVRPW